MSDQLSNTSSALDGISGQMSRLEGITGQFGRTLSKSLVQGIAQGKSFEDILQGMGDKLIKMSLNSAFKPLENIVDGLFNALTGTATSLVSGALGGAGGGSSGGGGFLASGGAAASSPITINMAVTSPDAASFKASEAQVSSSLARAVARGQRSL